MKTSSTTALAAAASLLLIATPTAQNNSELKQPVRLQAEEAFINTNKDIGHAGPMVIDHDADGLPDLLLSSFRGTIRFFKNVGTRSEPRFSEQEPLQAEGKPIRIHNW